MFPECGHKRRRHANADEGRTVVLHHDESGHGPPMKKKSTVKYLKMTRLQYHLGASVMYEMYRINQFIYPDLIDPYRNARHHDESGHGPDAPSFEKEYC